MEQRRPTLLGCLVENVRNFTLFLAFAIIGGFIGQTIDPQNGMRVGFVAGGLLAFLLPWRRWWRQWLERRFKNKE